MTLGATPHSYSTDWSKCLQETALLFGTLGGVLDSLQDNDFASTVGASSRNYRAQVLRAFCSHPEGSREASGHLSPLWRSRRTSAEQSK
uniref:Uncharacterized protein n=1 Tax=Amphidinium carterae TaxID=2961 RepID=A7YXH7_AMPCA|nr:unknown [Amphidinium carterae]